MAGWHYVAARSELNEEEMTERQVAGRRIVLALQGGALRAFQALCPHASAPLAEGPLRPRYLICPLHAYRFDLQTGRCLKPEWGPPLRLFAVELRGDEVWVKVEPPSPRR